jgi:hypothetical protein
MDQSSFPLEIQMVAYHQFYRKQNSGMILLWDAASKAWDAEAIQSQLFFEVSYLGRQICESLLLMPSKQTLHTNAQCIYSHLNRHEGRATEDMLPGMPALVGSTLGSLCEGQEASIEHSALEC